MDITFLILKSNNEGCYYSIYLTPDFFLLFFPFYFYERS